MSFTDLRTTVAAVLLCKDLICVACAVFPCSVKCWCGKLLKLQTDWRNPPEYCIQWGKLLQVDAPVSKVSGKSGLVQLELFGWSQHWQTVQLCNLCQKAENILTYITQNTTQYSKWLVWNRTSTTGETLVVVTSKMPWYPSQLTWIWMDTFSFHLIRCLSTCMCSHIQ